MPNNVCGPAWHTLCFSPSNNDASHLFQIPVIIRTTTLSSDICRMQNGSEWLTPVPLLVLLHYFFSFFYWIVHGGRAGVSTCCWPLIFIKRYEGEICKSHSSLTSCKLLVTDQNKMPKGFLSFNHHQ